MKILILANTHFPLLSNSVYQGGIETIVGESFKYLNKLGIETHICVPKDSTIEPYSEAEPRILYHDQESTLKQKENLPEDRKRVIFKFNWVAIKKYCEDNGITHVFSNNPNQKVSKPLEDLGLPTLHLMHQCIGEYFDFFNYKNMLNKYRNWEKANFKMAAVSNFVKEDVNTKLEFEAATDILAPTLYPDCPYNKDKKDEFIFVTRIQRNYRLKEVLEVLFRSGRGITLAGYNNDLAYYGELQDLADQYNVKLNYIGFMPRSDLIKVVSGYKYYLAQVSNEAFGLSVLEAASTGCVIVALGNSEKTGVVDFIGHANHIFIKEIKDKKEMSRQLLEFLAQDDFDGFKIDPEDQYNYFRNNFNAASYANKLVELLKSIPLK